MPIYIYQCTVCPHKRELLVKSWESVQDIHVICQKCSNTMLRNIGDEKPNFHLKGGGWATGGYGMSDRQCIAESDKEVKETERQRIREAKLNGTY